MAQFKQTKRKLQKINFQETENDKDTKNLKRITVSLNPEQFLKKIVRIKLFKKYDLENDIGAPISGNVTMIEGGGVG